MLSIPRILFVVAALARLLCITSVPAEQSATCAWKVWKQATELLSDDHEHFDADPFAQEAACTPKGTSAPVGRLVEGTVCGSIRQLGSGPGSSFRLRLSPQCAAVMDSYRAMGTPRAGLPLASPIDRQEEWRKCQRSTGAYSPTNPIIVQRPYIAPFAMCTVPKAACTSLRKLLYAVIHYNRDTPKPGAGFVMSLSDLHGSVYPTIWHYKRPKFDLTDIYPTFIISRNPYVRLVSGFIDKMVVKPEFRVFLNNTNEGESSWESHDWWNLQDMNKQLGMFPNRTFEATAESFGEFVHALATTGAGDNINSHFQQATRACDGGVMQYEFYMRLEDLPQWLPCFAAGIGIESWVWSGWHKNKTDGLQFTAAELARAKYGSITGPGITRGGPACWWHPKGLTCEQFWNSTRGKDGRAVPLDRVVQSTTSSDGHETGSLSIWRRFYNQTIGDLVFGIYRSDFVAFGYERVIFDQPLDGTASEGDALHKAKSSAFGKRVPPPVVPPAPDVRGRKRSWALWGA